MISILEDEFYKIIFPIIQKSDISTSSLDEIININVDILVTSRDKINLINNLKLFIKTNLYHPSLSIIFTKHLSTIFSDILFKCLNNIDQNVRIAADECINHIIRLTSNQFSPYIIYNLFIQLKITQSSPRSIIGALHKFSTLSHLIKPSKRQSYINNVLPVLQQLITNRSEESILLCLVESVPKIAETLFPFSNDLDIELLMIAPILNRLTNENPSFPGDTVNHQRSLCRLLSIIIMYMKDFNGCLLKLFKFCVSIDFKIDNCVTVVLLLIKSLLTVCNRDNIGDNELVILVIVRLVEVIEADESSAANKNLSLDCLVNLLRMENGESGVLFNFLASFYNSSVYSSEKIGEMLRNIDHDDIFRIKELIVEETVVENVENVGDLIEFADIEEDTLFTRFPEEYEADIVQEIDEETSLIVEVIDSVKKEEVELIVNESEESLVTGLGTLADWIDTPLKYIVKLLIAQFLPDCIDNLSSLAYLKKRRARVNSKVLAINCLSQVSLIDYNVLVNQISILNDSCTLPTAIDCVLFYINDEDSQLGGSAVSFLGQFISSQLSISSSPQRREDQNHIDLIAKIQWLLDNPISGQHLKFVLSSLRYFLWDLASTEEGPLVLPIVESVLHFVNHNYKLVRKEVISVCRCIDFRNIALLEQRRGISGLLKNMSLSEKCISTILILLSDVEQDVREDASNSFIDLIENGAFDDSYCLGGHQNTFCYSEPIIKSSSIDQKRLIPFLCSDINIMLCDIRRKIDQESTLSGASNHSSLHRSLNIIIEELVSCPVPSGKEMKIYLNKISGCVSVLKLLLERYPFNIHPQLWIGHVNNTNTQYTSTTTRNLLSHCLSLLNLPFIIMDMSLHSDILHLVTRLILHGGIEHLLTNNFVIDKTDSNSGIVLHLNTNLPLVASLKLIMIHLCRMLNVFWHVFQFITPAVPLHKTVIPNLSSQSSINAPKKKSDAAVHNKSSTNPETQSSTDSRPPRSRSSLGFFVDQPLYMSMYKALAVAYNSFLISSDSANYSDKLLILLSKTLESLSLIMEIISFNEVSPYVEEFLSYCSVFYSILPLPTIGLIIKLLGSLFGTNITAQWDPFLSQVFSVIALEKKRGNSLHDISHIQIKNSKDLLVKFGARLQTLLKNASVSSHGYDTLQIEKWNDGLSDTFQWVKASGKRREPGILRQMVSANSSSRPNLSHYIGLFEKHVFQCMRQYLSSSPEMQTSIIQLLCQLIYLRVNYCQLDSEQKFLSIILNQLENFSSSNVDIENKSSLIIEIIEFLILITYEKAGPAKRDQPILSLTQVIHSVEALLLNGINIKSVIIPSLWKIVCDLFVHRSVWLNNPGNFNLIPNANTSKEIEVQRETVLDLLLRKLLTYPETLEILTIIVEHSSREHEVKWEKLSLQVWNKVSSMMLEDQIEFSDSGHIDLLLRLVRVISLKAIINQPHINIIIDMVIKYKDIPLEYATYKAHITECARRVVSSYIIILHNIDLWKNVTTISEKDDAKIFGKKDFISNLFNILESMIKFHNFVVGHSRISLDLISAGVKLMKMLLILFIEISKSDHSKDQSGSKKDDFSELILIEQLSKMDHLFRILKEPYLDVLVLWDELKYIYGLYKCSVITIRSSTLQKRFSSNNVIQICRHLIEIDEGVREDHIKHLISELYVFLVVLSRESYVHSLFDFINIDENMSCYFLGNFSKFNTEISKNVALMMKWLNIVENLHLESSKNVINILQDYVISNCNDIHIVVVMKIDVILSSRLTKICDLNNETAALLEKMIFNTKLSFPKLLVKLQENKQPSTVTNVGESIVIDPLTNVDDESIFDEKKFWKLCIEKSLINHNQDVRLGPRLLQGGTLGDLEDIFKVNLMPTDLRSKDSIGSQEECDSLQSLNLPSRFIQQSLRLGFLRSGGGVMQEGIRVDFVFRLGEKLVFRELACMVDVTKECLLNEDYKVVKSSSLVGLLSALNDYLSLSCQLSVPLPVSLVDGNRIVNLIGDVCKLILKSKKICSRFLIEEILVLMTSCFCPYVILTNEGTKYLGKDLSLSYVSDLVNFLHMIVEKVSQQNICSLKRYPSFKNDKTNLNIDTVIKMDKILNHCLQGLRPEQETEFQRKLKIAIITIVRLPSLIKISRNPNNIKSFDVRNAESIINNPRYKDVLELDCLSKMNRDDLALAQSLFGNIGWTSRFMFEETWLIYLNLLHDKSPSAAITDKDYRDAPLSSEEVVEQGHCDSLGLLGLTNMLLNTTARPSPGNPICAQLEHRPRDKTPNLLHTKLHTRIGRKLSTIHGQLDEEIFSSHRGFKMMLSGWNISSWNIEREDSILQYRHDQINVNVLSKRISIGSRSPQISGSDNNHLDVLSCLQSLPIIYEQWLQLKSLDDTKKSVALWPRVCALRSSVMLMDLFSSREQVQWLFECLLELKKSINIEDDWITLSWLCIGLSKCVAVLETSSDAALPQISGKPQAVVTTNSIYGLSQAVKIIETCLSSDLTILQQSALHSAMFLLQMTIYGKAFWDLPSGSLIELKNLHDMVISYLERQLLMMDIPSLQVTRRSSFGDISNNILNIQNSNSFSQTMSTGASNLANTVSELTSISSMNSQMSLISGGTTSSNIYPSQSTLPRIMKGSQGLLIRSERHNHLIMATACFYCETYPEALPESDLLNNFVTLAKNVMQTEKAMFNSATSLLILCRCIERCLLTQRVSVLVIEQIIRISSNYLKTCKSTTHSLPVLRLFLTSCYLSLANSQKTNSVSGVFESAFYNGPSTKNEESQLIMLERVNVFWKRLTDPDIMDVVESRILSRLMPSIMTEFMSSEEILNKTVQQLLRTWPKAQYVAKMLFDIITRCFNQPDGEKIIRKWTIMVLPSLTSCRPVNLSVWVTTIVLVASSSPSRSSLRALFSQCLDWLSQFEVSEGNLTEMETCLFIASFAFINDMSRDPSTEIENKSSFFKAIYSNLNIPIFQKLYTICLKKKLI